jgi:hypothetical protein
VSVHTVLRYDPIERSYKAMTRNDVETFMQPYPEIYSLNTLSGSPIFPICTNCFFLAKSFMDYRDRHPKRSVKKPLINLEALYRGLERQYMKDAEGQKVARALQWSHGAYREGVPITGPKLNDEPHHAVIDP